MRWVVLGALILGGCGGAPQAEPPNTDPLAPSPRDVAIAAAKTPGPHWLRQPRVRDTPTGQLQKDCDAEVGEACFALALQAPLPPGRADAGWDARVKLHRQACEAGVPLGCYFGGDLIARGLARNSGSATEGLEMVTWACKAGVLRACTRVGEMVTKGVYPPAQPSVGGEIYRAVCAAGEAAACAELALTQDKATLSALAALNATLDAPTQLYRFRDRACKEGDATDCRRASAPIWRLRQEAVAALKGPNAAFDAAQPTQWLRDLCLGGDHMSCVHFTVTCGRLNLPVCGISEADLERGARPSVRVAGVDLAALGGCHLTEANALRCDGAGTLTWYDAPKADEAEQAGRAALKQTRAHLELMDNPVVGEAQGACSVMGQDTTCGQLTTRTGATLHWGRASVGDRHAFFVCSAPAQDRQRGVSAPCSQVFGPAGGAPRMIWPRVEPTLSPPGG